MTVPFILREVAFWIFFICLLYVFFRKPRADQKRKDAFLPGFQEGDRILTNQGLVGTVERVDNGRVRFTSGSENDCFHVAITDVRKNESYALRRKHYLKSLTPLQFLKAVL